MITSSSQPTYSTPRQHITSSLQALPPTSFNEYCETIPPWCRYLLSQVDFIADEEDLCDALESSENLYFATDGGETNGIRYFGWVIANVCNHLLEANGHAPGEQSLMESLQTESTAILSILCFLLHFSSFHNLALTADAWLQICDNSTAVRRMKWINLFLVLKLSLTLAADFDIQLQIEDTLKQLGIHWHTEHVKGHQSGPDLLWEEKLNNCADKLVTEAKLNITTTLATRRQLQYPAAQIHLTIDNKNIIRIIEQVIHETYTGIKLKDDLLHCFNWTNATYTSISWALHGSNL
eukprot:4036114-Ditylum_brightwellii.AAC.1